MSRISSRRHGQLPVRHRGPSFRPFSETVEVMAPDLASPFSIRELEIGLRSLGRTETQQTTFWDKNIARFRHTVLVAIRDTSDALLSQSVTTRWRIELESQLETLVQYLEFADRYVAERDRSVSNPTIS